jgi:uncharacterized protein YoxC
MNAQQKVLKQFQDSMDQMKLKLEGMTKDIQKISVESEKELSEDEIKLINDFKRKVHNLKKADLDSIINLKAQFEKKIKDGI